MKAHVALVLPALALGTWLIFFSRKGAGLHRLAGAVFLGLIAAAAIVALFIPGRIPIPGLGLGPIHLIIPFSFFAIWRAYDGARDGNVQQHRTWIHIVYFALLILVFLMNALVFPGITQNVIFGPHVINPNAPIIETVFQMGSRAALTGWLALVLAPFARRVRDLLFLYSGIIVPALLALVYVALVVQIMIGAPVDGAGFDTLAGVRATLSSDARMTAVWHHFMAFDLFVGTWIARDGLGRGVPVWMLVPIFGLTLLCGPAGLLAYLIPRAALSRNQPTA